MIDLHVHSRCSDGLLEPEALAEAAARAGLTAVALTDHDSVDGVARMRAAAGDSVRVVPGVELDTDHEPGTLHVLGYFVDPEHPGLRRELARLRASREERLGGMLAALAGLGLEVTEADVRREAAGGVLGRPHVARALVARGAVRSEEAAFHRYLAKGRPAWVGRFTHSPAAAIALIRAAGGVAVLAHPKTLSLTPRALGEEVGRLAALGLGGIEVFYPDHNAVERRRFGRLAARFGLVATGGTDYHGELPGRPRLGVGHGDLRVPESVIEELRARA